MSKKYYEQVGDEFVEAGYEFTGWPANGIWVVADSKQNCIYQFEGVANQPSPTLISYLQYQDELTRLISSKWQDKALSVSDIASIACNFFAIKAGAMVVGDTIIEN